MDLDALKAELADPVYAEMSDQEAASYLNTSVVSAGVCKPYHIANFFVAIRNDAALDYVNKALYLHAVAGRDIDFSDPDDLALVATAMDILIEKNIGVTEAHKASVLTLGDGRDTRTRAERLGLGLVKLGHIEQARAA